MPFRDHQSEKDTAVTFTESPHEWQVKMGHDKRKDVCTSCPDLAPIYPGLAQAMSIVVGPWNVGGRCHVPGMEDIQEPTA